MEFSDDYSPIIDFKDRNGKDTAKPFIKSTVASVLSTLTDQIFDMKNTYFRKWKTVTVLVSEFEQNQLNNWCFIASQKARLSQRALKNLLNSQYNRTFSQILLVSSVAELENIERKEEILNLKLEIGKIRSQNLNEKEKLEAAKEKLSKGLQSNPEFVINEMRMLKEENSQLQDKLLTYEIHFGSYIREAENLLRNNKVSSR